VSSAAAGFVVDPFWCYTVLRVIMKYLKHKDTMATTGPTERRCFSTISSLLKHARHKVVVSAAIQRPCKLSFPIVQVLTEYIIIRYI
jgi:hypothetical protein